MSQSNASAIKRRTNLQPTTPTIPPAQPPVQTSYTIQQVIATFDKRISQLEKETVVNSDGSSKTDLMNDQIIDIVEEFNNRFELIVTEINNLKDIIINLQSFTMDVNKSLMNERIHILSDMGTTESVITMGPVGPMGPMGPNGPKWSQDLGPMGQMAH